MQSKVFSKVNGTAGLGTNHMITNFDNFYVSTKRDPQNMRLISKKMKGGSDIKFGLPEFNGNSNDEGNSTTK